RGLYHSRNSSFYVQAIFACFSSIQFRIFINNGTNNNPTITPFTRLNGNTPAMTETHFTCDVISHPMNLEYAGRMIKKLKTHIPNAMTKAPVTTPETQMFHP